MDNPATQGATLIAKSKFTRGAPRIMGRLFRGRWAVSFGLVLLLAFHAAANIAWLRRDNHEITRDEAVHMELARRYFDAFTSPAYKNLPQRVIAASNIESRYPPLTHALAGGLMAVLGYGADTMALLSTLSLLAIIAGAFGIARTFLGPAQSLYAALITSLIPIVYASSRYLALDYLAAAFVIWGMLCLARSDALRSTFWVTGLAVMLGLCIMVRQTTVLFFAGPVLLAFGFACARVWKREVEWRRIGLNASIASVVLFAIVVPWHYANFESLYTFWFKEYRGGAGIIRSAVAAVVEPRGTGSAPEALAAGVPGVALLSLAAMGQSGESGPGVPSPFFSSPVYKIFRHLVIDLVNNSLFLPASLVALAGGLAMIARRRPGLPVLLVVLWPISGMIAWYSLMPVMGNRYTIPAIPAFGLWCAAGVGTLPVGRIRGAAGAGFILILLLTFANISLGSSTALSRLEIPVPDAPYDIERSQDNGIVVYKNRIIAGNYTYGAPFTGENPTERILRAIARDARASDAPPDTYLTLQQVGAKYAHGGGYIWHGDFFSPEQFAPSPNPYLIVPEDESLPRPFRRIGPYSAYSAAELLPELDRTDYVLIRYPAAPFKPGQAQKLDEWKALFSKRHFVPLEEFSCPQWDTIPDSQYIMLKRFGYPREIVSLWDFAGGTAGPGWSFPDGGENTADGIRYLAAGRVSGPSYRGGPLPCSDVDTVTLRTGGPEVPVERIALYWKRDGDNISIGDPRYTVPFMYSDRLGAWEASPRRHKHWTGSIEELYIGIEASTGSLAKVYGFTGADIVSGAVPSVREWGFTDAGPWDFRGRTAFSPEGAVRSNPKNGWGPRLMAQSIEADNANMLWIRLSTSGSNGGPLPIGKMHFYWARASDSRSRNPFGHDRAVPMYPLGGDPDGRSTWIADMGQHAAWKGEVRDIFVGMDFSGKTGGWFDSSTITIESIGFVRAAKQPAAAENVTITVRDIAFNRIALAPVDETAESPRAEGTAAR